MADMSIQMILGESTSLIAAVRFFRILNFVYSGKKALSVKPALNLLLILYRFGCRCPI